MIKKHDSFRKGKDHLPLTREESDELQMILDRLAVQDPEGESFGGYLDSLRKLLSGRPHLAAALIDRLSRNPSTIGFRVLQVLDECIKTSPYKRSLKQAAYRFSQKGFTLSEHVPAPEKVVLIRDEQRKASSHLFMVQGAVWVVSALVPEASVGGYILVTAFLEDDLTAFNVRVIESRTQKRYREYLQALSANAVGERALEIPLWHAARLFFEMLDFCTGKDSYTTQLERGRDLFERYHEPDRRPYVYELMPEIEHPEQHFSELEIEKLLEDLDLSWLKFGKEELSPYHERLKGLDRPLLVVPGEIQEERRLEVIDAAAESLCVGTRRRIYTRFFEEQAMAFKLLGYEDKARWAMIVAGSLAGQSPPGKNPVVTQLIIDSMNFYWPEDFKEGGEEAPGRERRTESGIILP